jgi:hypothetical protein
VKIAGVYGNGDEIVSIAGVLVAVYDVERPTEIKHPSYPLPRTTSNAQCGDKYGSLTTVNSDNFRPGRHPPGGTGSSRVTEHDLRLGQRSRFW